ncbi:MAG TPA: potassium channel family protein [Myxococcota bacterium]|nr:potassium channel family protein [Myxococcota bacterium]
MRTLFDAYLRHRFACLLALLILAIGVDPVLEAFGARGRALEWMLVLALVAALPATSRALALVSGAALLVWVMLHGGADWGTALARALLGTWCVAMGGFVLSFVLAAEDVDAEHISAALCVYFLVGLGFGAFFASLDFVEPASLAGARATGALTLADSVYFSFVTLATLGYGDIVPASLAARSLAVLEAVFGQLYLAVLVARLVSIYARE